MTVAEELVSAVYCHRRKREAEVLGGHFHSVVLGFDESNMPNLHSRLSHECLSRCHVPVIPEHGCIV